MNHCGTQCLDTKRLHLRPFTLDDAQAMFENWASDPVVTHYMPWPPHGSVEDSRAVLADWIAAYPGLKRYEWCIVEKSTGAPVGSIGVSSMDEAAETLEAGYCLSQSRWGKGYVPEALAAVLAYLFDRVGARRVIAKHDCENVNSGKVMQKCGMTFLEKREGCILSGLGVRDALVYQIENPKKAAL